MCFFLSGNLLVVCCPGQLRFTYQDKNRQFSLLDREKKKNFLRSRIFFFFVFSVCLTNLSYKKFFFLVCRDACHFYFFKQELCMLRAYVIIAIVQDPCRMGVWLGWHICQNATQVSQGQLRENRNLSLSIRAKAVLIYVLSVPVHNVKKITCKFYEIYLLCVKARPSDPLVYV